MTENPWLIPKNISLTKGDLSNVIDNLEMEKLRKKTEKDREKEYRIYEFDKKHDIKNEIIIKEWKIKRNQLKQEIETPEPTILDKFDKSVDNFMKTVEWDIKYILDNRKVRKEASKKKSPTVDEKAENEAFELANYIDKLASSEEWYTPPEG